MNSVFIDPKLEKQFRKNGYIKIPFFDLEIIERLKLELQSMHPDDAFSGNQDTKIGKQSFHITFFDKNEEYKNAVFQMAKEHLAHFTATKLNNYSCAQANVFLKHPGSGFVYPHQNITIVDEAQYTSVSVWIPLQDTDMENGTICLIPGSQNYFEKYRNTHVYWPYVSFFKDGPGKDKFSAINVKLGEVLIIDDRIVHYTPNNNSASERWVFHSLWKPSIADLYFFDPVGTKVKAFLVTDQFWQYHRPGELIQKRSPDRMFDFTPVIKYTDTELLELLDKLSKSEYGE